MFGFIRKAFFTGLTILSNTNHLNSTSLRTALLNATQLSATPLSAALLKCVSINNQECKVRPEIVNVNSDEPVFYAFSIKTSKCSGSYNNINDQYARMCVPNVAKNLNIKVFNLMSRTNEQRHIKWCRCNCKCKFDASVCNNKRWNDDKCRYECKELADKGVCDKGSVWNHSNVSANVINHVILVNI